MGLKDKFFQKKRLFLIILVVIIGFSAFFGLADIVFLHSNQEDIINEFKEENEIKTEIAKRLIESAQKGETVAFVGDSITDKGWWKPMLEDLNTTYADRAWYKPITKSFQGNLYAKNMGSGGDTTVDLLDRIDEIKQSNIDLFVLAIGFNDIRYGPKPVDDYLENMQEIITTLEETGEVVIVSIWPSFPGDEFRDDHNGEELDKIIDRYNEKLKLFSEKRDLIYSEPTPIIKEYIDTKHHFTSLIMQLDFFVESNSLLLKL